MGILTLLKEYTNFLTALPEQDPWLEGNIGSTLKQDWRERYLMIRTKLKEMELTDYRDTFMPGFEDEKTEIAQYIKRNLLIVDRRVQRALERGYKKREFDTLRKTTIPILKRCVDRIKRSRVANYYTIEDFRYHVMAYIQEVGGILKRTPLDLVTILHETNILSAHWEQIRRILPTRTSMAITTAITEISIAIHKTQDKQLKTTLARLLTQLAEKARLLLQEAELIRPTTIQHIIIQMMLLRTKDMKLKEKAAVSFAEIRDVIMRLPGVGEYLQELPPTRADLLIMGSLQSLEKKKILESRVGKDGKTRWNLVGRPVIGYFARFTPPETLEAMKQLGRILLEQQMEAELEKLELETRQGS